MSRREVGKYIEDLLAGRQPKPFAPDEFEAAQLRAAIDLTAAREGADEPQRPRNDALLQRQKRAKAVKNVVEVVLVFFAVFLCVKAGF